MRTRHGKKDEARVVRRFLWFPTTLLCRPDDHWETRWLEWAQVEQFVSHVDGRRWIDHRFVEE